MSRVRVPIEYEPLFDDNVSEIVESMDVDLFIGGAIKSNCSPLLFIGG